MSTELEKKQKKNLVLPHIFIILFAIIVLATILTWIVPAGNYDYVESESGTQMAVAGTWHEIEATPVNIWEMFQSVYNGMVSAASICMFVFISFASVSFITKSGAFDGLVTLLLKVFKGKSSVIIIPILVALLGLSGSTVGMFEEWLPFVPIFVAIFIAMGYDAVVGVGTLALGIGLGYSGAVMNPFTVGVAQSLAGVDYMSGWGYRIICHVVMILVASFLLIRYALKVKGDPSKSLVYGDDFSSFESKDADAKFTLQHGLVLADLLACIVVVVWGVTTHGWYFSEIATVFLIMGIVAGIIMRLKINDIAKTFEKGFEAAAMAAMMIGLARGILLVLQSGNIIDTIVNALATPLGYLPTWLSAIAMLILQTLLNLFIPSGSGQAATSIPIMAPLADVLGLTRNTAILAYQFGDGLSNIVWPTGFAPAIAALGGVKLDKWWKFIFPVFGILVATQAILVVIAVLINFA